MTAMILNRSDQFEQLAVTLARELAKDLLPLEDILSAHRVTPEQWASVQRTKVFQEVLESEIAAWNASHNTAERIKLKAQALVEDSLLHMGAQLYEPDIPLNHKVELLKQVSRIAQVDVPKDKYQGETGNRFQLTINIGETQSKTITATVTPRVTPELDFEDIE